MPATVQINIDEELYLRPPTDTKLGRNILQASVDLISRDGFDAFNFKKLAEEINSTEASVYRYFKNKLQLLNYLLSWYWTWIQYQISVRTTYLEDSSEKIKRIIEILVNADLEDPMTPYVNEASLHKIVVGESARIYFTNHEHHANDGTGLDAYNSLVNVIADTYKASNKKFKYPYALAMTTISSAHKLVFDLEILEKSSKHIKTKKDVNKYLEDLVFKSLSI